LIAILLVSGTMLLQDSLIEGAITQDASMLMPSATQANIHVD
jgi:hypothetical protein